MSNAQKIWDRLTVAGLTPAGAAGLMGNLYAESGLDPENLQNTYEGKLGFTDAGYTVAVDNGTYAYANFAGDCAGYGIAQWTHPGRKANLYVFAEDADKSIGDLDMQVDFLLWELQRLFPAVLEKLRTTGSVREASDCVLLKFERPASVNDTKKVEETKARRAEYAQEFYDKFVAGACAGMTYYRTAKDVPSYYRSAVQKAMDKGALNGTGKGEINVSEDLCRTLTVLDRLGKLD